MSPKKQVVVATHNAHKVVEIRAILDIPDWEFVSLDELGISEEPVEDADSFVGNARIKAQFAHERTGLAVLADDSGLAVDALGGAPGVFSSRYAGMDSNDTANNQKLLSEMEQLAGSERAASFVCALVFIDDDGHETVVQGEFSGRIGTEPRGSNGFGYDPLFLLKEFDYKRSLAELSEDEKNAVSHRFLALKELRELLTQGGQAGHTASQTERVAEDAQKEHTPTNQRQIAAGGQAEQSVSPQMQTIAGSQVDQSVSPKMQIIPGSQAEQIFSLKRQIVAFDFDGTLIDASSPVRLITRLNRDRIMSKKAVAQSMLWGARYKTGKELDQAKPRRYIFASFKDFSASDANAIMKNLYLEELRQYLRPQAVAALREHLEAGRKVLIVSASFAPIISELCEEFGISDFICTQMEVIEGSYTGETIGDPPESEQKLIQFTEWANKKYGLGAWELAYAYGDHFSDIPLMETAKHPIVVDPDRRMRSIAKERGWEMYDWPLDESN